MENKYFYVWLLYGLLVLLTAGLAVAFGDKHYIVRLFFSVMFLITYFVGSEAYHKYKMNHVKGDKK